MVIEVLDPTYERDNGGFKLAPRLARLDGARIAVVSNGKKGTKPFFDAYEMALSEDYGVAEVVRLMKQNYSAPMEIQVLDGAEKWHALVAGVGD